MSSRIEMTDRQTWNRRKGPGLMKPVLYSLFSLNWGSTLHILKMMAGSIRSLLRITFIHLIAFAHLILLSSPASSSWLIDAMKYHVSVHGQNSCQDCHENVSEEFHPNPADVSKELTDFFNVDQCISCHDNILEDLDRGLHGSEKIKDPEGYSNCLECHEPHYQLSIDELRIAQFDPRKPIHEQCGACHKEQSTLPPFSDEDKGCMICHQSVELEDPEGQERITQLCFHCHGDTGLKAQKITNRHIPAMSEDGYQSTPHADISCMVCHPRSAAYHHGEQTLGDCNECHVRHDEKVTHDAHMLVSCEACHLNDVHPVRDVQSKRVLWTRKPRPGNVLTRIHHMTLGNDNSSCKRCHFEGNELGAATIILPAKSILCMPCHAATFSVGDTTTIIALIIFLAGIVLLFSYVLSGSMTGKTEAGLLSKLLGSLWESVKTVLSRKIFSIMKAIFLDVLLQRRLYRQSTKRWVIHSLIFLPFAFRFTWGLIALIGSLWKPQWSPVWVMLDKNHPITAFLFDLTGIMVILGLALAYLRGLLYRSTQLNGMPKQDLTALSLIGGIVIVGFILEGMRIAMTGNPSCASFAFVGYGISTLFSNPNVLTDVYGYIWYIHAILTGALIAYIPFSRLLHIIIAPVVLTLNATSESERKDE